MNNNSDKRVALSIYPFADGSLEYQFMKINSLTENKNRRGPLLEGRVMQIQSRGVWFYETRVYLTRGSYDFYLFWNKER